MPKLLIRFVAFLLLPALLGDPITAAAVSNLASSGTGQLQTASLNHPLFDEQALQLVLSSSQWFGIGKPLGSHARASVFAAFPPRDEEPMALAIREIKKNLSILKDAKIHVELLTQSPLEKVEEFTDPTELIVWLVKVIEELIRKRPYRTAFADRATINDVIGEFAVMVLFLNHFARPEDPDISQTFHGTGIHFVLALVAAGLIGFSSHAVGQTHATDQVMATIPVVPPWMLLSGLTLIVSLAITFGRILAQGRSYNWPTTEWNRLVEGIRQIPSVKLKRKDLKIIKRYLIGTTDLLRAIGQFESISEPIVAARLLIASKLSFGQNLKVGGVKFLFSFLSNPPERPSKKQVSDLEMHMVSPERFNARMILSWALRDYRNLLSPEPARAPTRMAPEAVRFAA